MVKILYSFFIVIPQFIWYIHIYQSHFINHTLSFHDDNQTKKNYISKERTSSRTPITHTYTHNINIGKLNKSIASIIRKKGSREKSDCFIN